jgi:hypothetical protein
MGLNSEPLGKAEGLRRQYRLVAGAVMSLQAGSSAQRSDIAVSSELKYWAVVSDRFVLEIGGREMADWGRG